MASNAQRYAVGIGTGAASGAALGTEILPGWGTVIGGVLGAGAGAIGAAASNDTARKNQEIIQAQRDRERKTILLNLLENQGSQGGMDSTLTDTIRQERGLSLQNAAQDRQLANANRLDANSFVPMAKAGVAIGKGLYSGFSGTADGGTDAMSTTNNQFQLTPLPGSLADDNYQNAQPQWAQKLQL
jgi:hypothetical protein